MCKELEIKLSKQYSKPNFPRRTQFKPALDVKPLYVTPTFQNNQVRPKRPPNLHKSNQFQNQPLSYSTPHPNRNQPKQNQQTTNQTQNHQ